MTEEENYGELMLLEQKPLRRIWHKGELYYNIRDVINAFEIRAKKESKQLKQITPLLQLSLFDVSSLSNASSGNENG